MQQSFLTSHKITFVFILFFCLYCSCTETNKDKRLPESRVGSNEIEKERETKYNNQNATKYQYSDTIGSAIPLLNRIDTIIDADYNFEEAVAGSVAPQSIIDQLELFTVFYHSTDGKIHRGQILSNKAIVEDLKNAFIFMLNEKFVVEKVIPIVRYGWNDSLSMDENNSYAFCYRNIGYSKHATGMAIDINPRFNPLRWKIGDHENQPVGAKLDTTVNGTLYPGHPVVDEFRRLGFRWGHTFSKFYDDHHFEKK